MEDWAVSELRIVLLGKNVSETCRVGNFILGRDIFETEAPPPSVEQNSKRARGLVDGRYITVIDSPHLLHTELSQVILTLLVKVCASLSAPGPQEEKQSGPSRRGPDQFTGRAKRDTDGGRDSGKEN
ncbi:hypothetical protein P4O66_003483 [Electrophorus voltai]|uniref:AIG1-type G domain-containing protein n=1 Tax=Electrophorus voltai TaxID=2609070 RepID=A0AAD9DK75_9TELE|nr:hypothetical protein P4O66_003483 [Electrophorus voltai]